jgi:hypothetical protein
MVRSTQTTSMPAQLGRSTVTTPGSDEVPTKRAEYATIRRDFPDPVDESPPPLAPIPSEPATLTQRA